MGPLVWKEAFGKNRINSFNDLNSATQELIRKGFAFHKKIALTGTSNGGLLVLSAAGLRPDLYGAVISLSPVVDVLNLPTLDARYASTWLELDYGDIKDPEVEKFWKVHQPISLLPQVKNLPPILLRSAHGDEIVSPLHVFNLYEQLMKRKDRSQFFMYHQPKSFDHNPKNIKQGIEESSYIQTFLFKALGVKIKEMKD